ncbi:2-hydroxyacid dehydrogenase [Pseudohoeflea coraliihabitans]|uniref:Glyoxylate/hydroxypyruvate reductase A n=1 Tax=Pseudohoeflea coraliihabitans TaxID=2860393 RepID=A0ABS6WQ57_9HYPH|nr:glyoxylate/hydroxypyruvate reductase A [Pseudohoeflea sp. DP4N28-3]MBW3097773.1 glyoxylate/hydroxypyruvate reductase A [Pseudohoeflea sp. DP4N28-3]
MAERGHILLAVTGWDPQPWQAALARHAPDRRVVLAPDGAQDPAIDYALVWNQQAGLLTHLPNLKAIFSLGAGVDHIFNDPELPEVPIARVVSPDLTERMSEYVAWQVLDHHRRGPAYRKQQEGCVWHEFLPQPAASEMTVGIMGLGELGRDAARKLRSLGFRVSGWSRRAQQIEGIDVYAGAEQMPDFLASAEIFVVLLPLTPETRGILNHGTFAAMTRREHLAAPVLINAGRGGLQVESDIVAALDMGLLSAASLDVFETEPLDAASPLWGHAKITVTPHAAAASSPDQLVGPIIAQIEAFERGARLDNLVDRRAGY